MVMIVYESSEGKITAIKACVTCKHYDSKNNYCKLHRYATYYDNHCKEYSAIMGVEGGIIWPTV